ncbi:unnamed protein product [Thlaspi arvense]|uniref:PUM-HD domain-containing protein n=1 Tax=Thlaspi arvense TaxID=13288 RepID=A0AAU9S4X0_THLAR|nr:unnamed protein product [Thlaspi arvense]
MLGGKEGSFGDDLEKEISLLLRERRQDTDELEKELNLYRSGSAPPTVEGSQSAVGGLLNHGVGGGAGAFSGFANSKNGNGFTSEEELRSDPAYLSYYYSNVNLNPRLPPPLLSKEDWRFTQRLQGGVSALKAGSEIESEKVHSQAEWGGDGLIGLPGLGLGGKQKSLAEIFQSAPFILPEVGSGTLSHIGLGERDDLGVQLLQLGILPGLLAVLLLKIKSTAAQNVGPPASYSYAAALGASLSRSTTPDPQLIARAPSPCLAPIGGERLSNDIIDEGDHLSTQIEQEVDDHKNYLFNLQTSENNPKQHPYMKKSEPGHLNMPFSGHSAKISYSDSSRSNGAGLDLGHSSLVSDSKLTCIGPRLLQLNYGLGGFSVNAAIPSMMAGNIGTTNLPPLYENVAAASGMALPGMDSRVLAGSLPSGSGLNLAASESQNPNRSGNQMAGGALQASLLDPMYLQYLRTAEYASALNDPSLERNYLGNAYVDLLQKAYLGALLSPQRSQYGVPMGMKSGGPNPHGYYGNPAYGVGLSYPGSPLANQVIPNSPAGSGSPIRHAGSSMEDSFASCLLEEFKNNKTKCFELSEICSADQYGSRFIQQKLESATTEEKNMVFEEIIPQALTLMTDVFGNYVIQKFFEHGMPSQRRELACKLFGHVLTLSLQMYGCRNLIPAKVKEKKISSIPVVLKILLLIGIRFVSSSNNFICFYIQAIEVVDLDQKIKMVEELDGHVMRCVRDQNGNHVIQKCIECVPEEHIQFIVSTFFDQVVNLSTHPYGCRVIQRILEHCKDPTTQSKVMDEILGSVSMLAQDQYGNYVVQHVLEHGKPHERSIIIKELAGKIVQMSQQKFASNVVEKCLTFGDPSERQLLVNEMLGSTDENEPLQVGNLCLLSVTVKWKALPEVAYLAMMKDHFANYVVQKVLETCDDQQRELILSRIKVHLNALKKYTYGKHIVARVEKLVAAGERRIAAQASHPA